MTNSTFKHIAKICLQNLKEFILSRDINKWENFPRTEHRKGRQQSAEFDDELSKLILNHQSTLLSSINSKLESANIGAKILYITTGSKENNKRKNNTSLYDIMFYISPYDDSVDVFLLVNVKYWENNNNYNNVGGGTELYKYILSKKPYQNLELGRIGSFLNHIEYDIKMSVDEVPKDYFIFVIYKGSEKPCENIKYCSLFDVAPFVQVNQNQGSSALQLSALFNPNWTYSLDERENKRQTLIWLKQTGSPKPYYEKVCEILGNDG